MQESRAVLVSVIMPVYNAEEFLRETLDTVVNQTLKEIEIICVDDGSTDGTFAILREYADADNRIIVLTQQNQYAGVARNNGLSKATGKYIVFWDADDLFELEALAKLYSRVEEDAADICVCSGNQLDNNTGEMLVGDIYLQESYLPANRPFAKGDMPENIFRFSTNVPWNKMFRREFLTEHQLQFQNLKQANDTYFVLMALFLAQKITYVKDKLITYRLENANSLTGKASDTTMCAYESYEKTRKELFKQKDFVDNEELQRGFANRAFQGFLHSLFSQRNIDTYAQLYQFLATKGLKEFELIDKGEDYFINKTHARRLQGILTMQPNEFLLSTLKESQSGMKKMKSRNSLKKQKIKKQERTIKQQQQILDSLAVRTALKTKKILTFNGKLRYKK